MNKLNFSNPLVFLGTVLILFISVIVTYIGSINIYENKVVENTSFEKHSFSNSEKELGKYDFPDINTNLNQEDNSILSNIFSKDTNILMAILIIYSVALSILFAKREKSRITKEMLDEKLNIQKERLQSKVNIIQNIEEELLKHKEVISPELNINDLDKRIDTETNNVLFNARIVLEKVLLTIADSHNVEEETLSNMIYKLNKKGILNSQTRGYALTIKSFGNRVAHPNIKNPMKFNQKDALLVLSTLVSLLDILKSQNLIESSQNV